MSNRRNTWSNISRCWAVTHTRQTNCARRRSSSFTTGAILIASGRVPNTESTFSRSSIDRYRSRRPDRAPFQMGI